MAQVRDTLSIKDVITLLTHWSYVFLALNRFVVGRQGPVYLYHIGVYIHIYRHCPAVYRNWVSSMYYTIYKVFGTIGKHVGNEKVITSLIILRDVITFLYHRCLCQSPHIFDHAIAAFYEVLCMTNHGITVHYCILAQATLRNLLNIHYFEYQSPLPDL